MAAGFLKDRVSGLNVLLCACFLVTVIGLEPAFDVPIVNVTVVKSQTAVLPCSIDHLGKFKVAWLDHNSIPLTYEDRRVVDDTRFSVIRPYLKEWNLQVRDIRWDDEGQYRCTINTNPVKSKLVMLHVKVPPEIIDDMTSIDVTVQEGDTVTLTCNVTGVPLPRVTWQRKSVMNKTMSIKYGKNCKHRTTGSDFSVLSMTLIIDRANRQCDDVYECTADNGVPPTVSRQIRLTVEFAPQIQMPNRRIGQVKGRETILECAITAFPHANNFWEKDGRRITSSMKHRIEAYDEGDHTLTLSLCIQITDATDFGEYKCVAANSLGQDEAAMTLYEYPDSADERLGTTSDGGDDDHPRSTATSIAIFVRPTQTNGINADLRALITPKHKQSPTKIYKDEGKHEPAAVHRIFGLHMVNATSRTTILLLPLWMLSLLCCCCTISTTITITITRSTIILNQIQRT